MAEVMSRREVLTAANPLTTEADIWADFRQIEVLTLELTQRYQHSLGKTSRFFLALEQRNFLATRCDACAKVYAPPRPFCPDCATVTRWVELRGTGTLETFSVMHFHSHVHADVAALPMPCVLGYVLLDGAHTLFPHLVDAPLEAIRMGMRLRVDYREGPVYHPIHLMRFIPLES